MITESASLLSSLVGGFSVRCRGRGLIISHSQPSPQPHQGTCSSALLARIGGISQKMLTQTLRDLERNGLIIRQEVRTVPPHVEYRLSRLGVSLSDALAVLDRWAERHFPELDAARDTFDRKQS
jgi:DNA-binding HxlR family transcriptional regulator